MNCRICSSKTDFFARSKILIKYNISYFRCNYCGFIQTEEPYWLAEAYSEAINSTDIGLVNRNIMFAKICSLVIPSFFNQDGKFIDYGGGYGLFVRLMRDAGFNFYWHDKFCLNVFAKGFQHNESMKNQYEVATAFEVFEHMKNPIDSISEILTFSSNILFSTELLPDSSPQPGTWWYYGIEHGQHISFYSIKTLSIIAEKFNANLYSNGKSFHLLTRKRLSPGLFHMLSSYKIATIFSIFLRKKSLLQKDHAESLEALDR